MPRFVVLFCVALFSLLPPAYAQPSKRFPQSMITATEWQQYFDEVKAIPDGKIQEGQIQTLISFAGPDRYDIYYFTKPNHPAHPAAIKIAPYVDSSGETRVTVTGNYAGSKKDFDPWFRWAFDQAARQSARQ